MDEMQQIDLFKGTTVCLVLKSDGWVWGMKRTLRYKVISD